MRAGVVSNRALVLEICTAARRACGSVVWPDGLARADARELVHQWLTDHSLYSEETDLQVIRLPRALVRDGVGDCKSSAVFAASMLHAAGYPVVLRFIKQPDRPWWSHVYAVAGGVAVDPLLPLGREASRTAHLDYPIE